MSAKKHFQNIIKDLGPSQEPHYHPNLLQSFIILQEGYRQTDTLTDRHKDAQTDRKTDEQTDRQRE